MKLIVCWLSDRSKQVLKAIESKLTKAQKKELKEKYSEGSMSTFLLSEALEIGLLALKRDYSIEQDLQDLQDDEPIQQSNEFSIDEVISDYESGMTVVQLAVKYGMSHSSIYTKLKNAGAIKKGQSSITRKRRRKN